MIERKCPGSGWISGGPEILQHTHTCACTHTRTRTHTSSSSSNTVRCWNRSTVGECMQACRLRYPKHLVRVGTNGVGSGCPAGLFLLLPALSLYAESSLHLKLQDDDDRQQTSVVATADGSLNQHARSHGPDTASEPGPGAGRARLSDCGALFARPAIRDAVSARAPRGGGVRPLLIDASFCRSLGGSQLRVVAYEVHAAAIVYNKPGRLRDRPMLWI